MYTDYQMMRLMDFISASQTIIRLKTNRINILIWLPGDTSALPMHDYQQPSRSIDLHGNICLNGLLQLTQKWGACHAIELPFVFYSKEDEIFGGNPPISLIEQVQDAWISFARNGDPNHSDLPVWPQYNEKDKPKMVFNVNPRVETDPGWDFARRVGRSYGLN